MRGPFRCVDTWFTSPVGRSFGWTLAYHDTLPQPIWRMGYDGWYDREDLRITRFLRSALRTTYEDGRFIGGRGPEVFTSEEFPGLIYYNRVKERDFRRFSGDDVIVVDVAVAGREGLRERYRHDYRGGALV